MTNAVELTGRERSLIALHSERLTDRERSLIDLYSQPLTERERFVVGLHSQEPRPCHFGEDCQRPCCRGHMVTTPPEERLAAEESAARSRWV